MNMRFVQSKHYRAILRGYSDGATLRETAAKQGISRQRVHQLEKTFTELAGLPTRRMLVAKRRDLIVKRFKELTAKGIHPTFAVDMIVNNQVDMQFRKAIVILDLHARGQFWEGYRYPTRKRRKA